MTRSLYEQDFLRWAEETAAKLKGRDFEHLDLENLIAEIESLGRSEKRELRSRLTVLLEHLLKRMYVDSGADYHGWETTIREQRRQLKLNLEDSPSLKALWENSFERAWQLAIADLRQEYPQTVFPDRWPHTTAMEAILNGNFWVE
ncbi:MAG TPA: DUF29 domain-containing protein [Cyanobacteria bacterium UBA8156]|jgi:hypothetical protein|nr:DUF29 domain-containing protein [Cyanobacteria bacterium UBA8156]